MAFALDVNASIPAHGEAGSGTTSQNPQTASCTFSTTSGNVLLVAIATTGSANYYNLAGSSFACTGSLNWRKVFSGVNNATWMGIWVAWSSAPVTGLTASCTYPGGSSGAGCGATIQVLAYTGASGGFKAYNSAGPSGMNSGVAWPSLTTQAPNSLHLGAIAFYTNADLSSGWSSTPAGVARVLAQTAPWANAESYVNSLGAAGTVSTYTVTRPAGLSYPVVANVELTSVPWVGSITPSFAKTTGGVSVQLQGGGFTGATGVLFGGVAATNVVVVDNSNITCTVPASAVAGNVDVTVQHPSGDGTWSNLFTYYLPTTSGFFSHMGSTYVGTGGGPLTTYNTILDDIVADVAAATAAGVNHGWSLWDDQRNLQAGPTTMVLGNAYYRGQANAGATVNGLSFTNANAAVTGYMTSFGRSFAPASFGIQLSNNGQAAWSANISSVTNDTSLTLASNWTAASATYQFGSERVVSASGGATYGYIVLKCTSQNGLNPFYVRIMREPSFGDLVRVDCWETWNNVAHAGTGNGPQELLRAFSTQQTKDTQVAYMLWLLPDTFALYTGQPPANNVAGDLFYAGNVTPFQPTQTRSTLIQACSHQGLSGFGTGQQARAGFGNASQAGAGASISRSFWGGGLWSPTNQQYGNTVYLVPRNLDYLDLVTVAYSDYLGRMPMTSYEVFGAANTNAGGNRALRIGTARFIKSPVMNPSNTFLSTFPADDGNTYIMVRAEFTVGTAVSGATSPVALDTATYRVSSGFATDLAPLGFAFSTMEIAFQGSGNGLVWIRRFFLLPVNI